MPSGTVRCRILGTEPVELLGWPDEERVFEIPDGATIWVGRKNFDNDVSLPGGATSRSHCCLRNEGGLCTVEDLWSRARTYLNEEALSREQSRPLEVGDQIRVTTVVISVEQIGTKQMSADEWRVETNPFRMLNYLRGIYNDRKLWLYSAACWERASEAYPQAQRVASLLEQHVEGFATRVASLLEQHVEGFATSEQVRAGLRLAGVRGLINDGWDSAWCASRRLLADSQAGDTSVVPVDLLREFFGNPLQPIDMDPLWLSWNNATVVQIAQRIYDEKAFGQLPILGDALQEAGCEHEDIVSHCYADTPHVRGCWVVDLMLGQHRCRVDP